MKCARSAWETANSSGSLRKCREIPCFCTLRKGLPGSGQLAALSLKAGILGAWLNVKINTGSLKDKAFAADAEARGQAVLDRAVPAADDCFARLLKMVES